MALNAERVTGVLAQWELQEPDFITDLSKVITSPLATPRTIANWIASYHDIDPELTDDLAHILERATEPTTFPEDLHSTQHNVLVTESLAEDGSVYALATIIGFRQIAELGANIDPAHFLFDIKDCPDNPALLLKQLDQHTAGYLHNLQEKHLQALVNYLKDHPFRASSTVLVVNRNSLEDNEQLYNELASTGAFITLKNQMPDLDGIEVTSRLLGLI